MSDDGLAVCIEEPLSRHTAWRTGGPCDAWVVVHRADALRGVLADCRAVGWKHTLIGAGTRTVVRDGGISGVVLRLGTDFARIEQIDDECWDVGAAVPVPALVAAFRDAGSDALAALADVPGSVGASLALDPGWDGVVEQVRYLGGRRERTGALQDVRGGKRMILGARIRVAPGEVAKKTKSPATPPSSWYCPPKRRSVRDALTSAALLQVRLRAVAIPPAAPELLVNLGGGTASDLALLHRSATERVKTMLGETLQPRLKWIGSHGPRRVP